LQGYQVNIRKFIWMGLLYLVLFVLVLLSCLVILWHSPLRGIPFALAFFLLSFLNFLVLNHQLKQIVYQYKSIRVTCTLHDHLLGLQAGKDDPEQAIALHQLKFISLGRIHKLEELMFFRIRFRSLPADVYFTTDENNKEHFLRFAAALLKECETYNRERSAGVPAIEHKIFRMENDPFLHQDI